jgi:hypothetical protein
VQEREELRALKREKKVSREGKLKRKYVYGKEGKKKYKRMKEIVKERKKERKERRGVGRKI